MTGRTRCFTSSSKVVVLLVLDPRWSARPTPSAPEARKTSRPSLRCVHAAVRQCGSSVRSRRDPRAARTARGSGDTCVTRDPGTACSEREDDMIDHFGINCADLEAAKTFYDKVLGTLGHRRRDGLRRGRRLRHRRHAGLLDQRASRAWGPTARCTSPSAAESADQVQAFHAAADGARRRDAARAAAVAGVPRALLRRLRPRPRRQQRRGGLSHRTRRAEAPPARERRAVREDGTVSPAIPSPIPHGRTARRLEWAHLPPAVRREIEQRCGSPVVSAASQGGGFTPGLRVGAHVRGRLAPLREGGLDGRAATVRRRPTGRRRASCAPCPTPSRRRACSGPWTATGSCSAWSTSRRGPRDGPGARPSSTPAWTPSRRWRTCSRPRRRVSSSTRSPTSSPPGRRSGTTSTPPATCLTGRGGRAGGRLRRGRSPATRWCTPTCATTTSCWRPTAAPCSATGTGRRSAPTGSTRCSC